MDLPPNSVSPPAPSGRAVLRFQCAAWGFFLLADIFLLSTIETVTWRKALNIALGILLSAVYSQLLWHLGVRFPWRTHDNLRQALFAAAACIVGGALVGFCMQPVERWAKLSDPGLEPGTFTDLWTFYGLMLALWSSLAAAFYLYDRTRRVEVERARFATAARDAELHAMRLQINPHFLFNAFATLRALVEENPGAAREAINHLAGMMRFALERAGRPTVPLEEELAHVHRFLELEKLRLDDRLRVFSHCEAGLAEVRVPPMSVQTLIENAVKYGVAARRAGGDVHYRIARDGDDLIVRVTNPGQVDAPSNSTGLGLDNLRQRLAHLHGEAGTLRLRQAAPDLVEAELRLPLREPLCPA